MNRKIVIAGNRRQFLDWCLENGRDPNREVFVHSPHVLCGLSIQPEDICRVGTWWEREDIKELEVELTFRTTTKKKDGPESVEQGETE